MISNRLNPRLLGNHSDLGHANYVESNLGVPKVHRGFGASANVFNADGQIDVGGEWEVDV